MHIAILNRVIFVALVLGSTYAHLLVDLEQSPSNQSQPPEVIGLSTHGGDDDDDDDDDLSGYWPPDYLLDDDKWNKFVCKGGNIMKATQASDIDAGHLFQPPQDSAQSSWMSIESLSTWFWHHNPNDIDPLKETPGYGIENALDALGLPKTASRDPMTGLEVIMVNHFDDFRKVAINEQTYTVGSKVYRSTGATQKFAINTGVGAIIAISRESPEHAGAKDRQPPVPKDGLPALQRSSDIMWLFWADRSSTPKKLKYFLTTSIINDETQETILRALDGQPLPEWPGRYFSTFFEPEAEAGKALLGSPNGRGFGYFLVQHKQQLGNMFVSGVRVFLDSAEDKEPCMIFYVQQELPQKPGDMGQGVERRRAVRVDSQIMAVSKNGTNIIRQHVLRSRL